MKLFERTEVRYFWKKLILRIFKDLLDYIVCICCLFISQNTFYIYIYNVVRRNTFLFYVF